MPIFAPWTWWRFFFRQCAGSGFGTPTGNLRTIRCRPQLESLESRVTPVTFVRIGLSWGGGGQISVGAGDINGDGWPDLATSNTATDNITVKINTTQSGSTPTFNGNSAFIPAGDAPYSLILGDLNGDGRNDYAVANPNDDTVSVLLNTTGAGAAIPTFAPRQAFATGDAPYAVALGDFNNDGRNDLAGANQTSDSVSVLLNSAAIGATTPAFLPHQPFAAGDAPFAIATGDFNGDGRADLVVANVAADTISLLLNTTVPGSGTASFSAPQSFPVGDFPVSVAVGDLNGDGRPDLAVANALSDNVTVLLNSTSAGAGAVSFFSPQTFPVGDQPRAVAAGDLNGDGRPDLAVANVSSSFKTVLINTTNAGAGATSFESPVNFGSRPGTNSVGMVDFDGDGRLDLAMAYDDDIGGVEVYGNRTVTFPFTDPVEVAAFPNSGVWRYNRFSASWTQLHTANPTALAAGAGGHVVASFPGQGVLLYRPTVGWVSIHPLEATVVAVDRLGDVAVNFPGVGVGYYRLTAGWGLLTTAQATHLGMDGLGNVTGNFPGVGIFQYEPGIGLSLLNPTLATALAVDRLGNVTASFVGIGVGQYRNGGWGLINGYQAQALTVDALGNVAASFQGFGIGKYVFGIGWAGVAPGAATSLLAGLPDGSLFIALPDLGVWEFDIFRGWFLRNLITPTLLAIA